MAFFLANLPLSGPDGSTTIVDASGRNTWSVATSGDTHIQDNALLLDGNGDYIFAPGSDFQFGSFNFKIEMEIKSTQTGRRVLVDYFGSSIGQAPYYYSWMWELDTNGFMVWRSRYYTTGNGIVGQGTVNVRDGNWHKLTVQRVAGVFYFYVDDVLDVTFTDPWGQYEQMLSYIGVGAQINSRNGGLDFAGSIRNFTVSRDDIPGAVTFRPLWRHFIANNIARQFTPWAKQPIWTPVFSDGRVKMFDQFCRTRGVPPWWGPVGSTTQLPTYKIRGRVMQRDPDGVLDDWPLANVRVALFFRRLNTLLDVKRSDANGYVQFDNLMPGNGAYYGVALDSEGAPLQNSIIWDRLTPEPGP